MPALACSARYFSPPQGNQMDVIHIATQWLDKLQQPDSVEFANLFTEDGMYVDPSWGLARQGREFVRLHHRKWHAAVPDLKASLERVLVDGMTAILLYEGTGTFNGEPLGAARIRCSQPIAHSKPARSSFSILMQTGLSDAAPNTMTGPSCRRASKRLMRTIHADGNRRVHWNGCPAHTKPACGRVAASAQVRDS